jgi:hypothetical protein
MSGNRSKSADAGGSPLLPSRITSPDILVFDVRQLQAILVQSFLRPHGETQNIRDTPSGRALIMDIRLPAQAEHLHFPDLAQTILACQMHVSAVPGIGESLAQSRRTFSALF